MTGMVTQLANEVKIMYSLYHQNIVKLFNHFEDDQNVYLCLEFAKGGQLYSKMLKQPSHRFDEKTVVIIIKDCVAALEYVHSKGIIHRDIKPENILIDDRGRCKLADFGWSNFENVKKKRDTYCGTLDYLAPEMVDESHKHDKTVDIWSIGVLLYELLTGRAPFSPTDDSMDQAKVESITKKNISELNIEFPSGFPPLAKDLVVKILQKEPSKRITFPAMREHPWLKGSSSSKAKELPKKLNDNTPEFQAAIEKHFQSNKELEEQLKKGAGFTLQEMIDFSRQDSILNGDYCTGQAGGASAKAQGNIFGAPKKEATGDAHLKKELDTMYKEVATKDQEVKNLRQEMGKVKTASDLAEIVKEKEELLGRLKQLEEERKQLKQLNDKLSIEQIELQLKVDNLNKQSQILSQHVGASDPNQLGNSNLKCLEEQVRSLEKQISDSRSLAESFHQISSYNSTLEKENTELRQRVLDLQKKIA